MRCLRTDDVCAKFEPTAWTCRLKRCINFCWLFFKWGLALLLFAALVTGGYLYFRLDEEIRQYTQRTLAKQYQGLEVTVGGARFVPGRGVTVFDIDLAVPQHARAPGDLGRLLHLDELTLAGRFELSQFIEGQPVVERVIVRRPRLEARRSVNGRWSFEQLLPLPQSGERSPPVEIVDGTLVVVDETKPQSEPMVLRNADLKVHRVLNAEGNQTSIMAFEASSRDSLAGVLELAGQLDPGSGACQVTASAKELRVDRQLLASLPVVQEKSLHEFGIEAVASFRVGAKRSGSSAPWDWQASFGVSGGVIEHRRLPRKITDLQLAGTCNARGLSISTLTAKCGGADVSAACNRSGWTALAPVAVRGRIVGLPLDSQLLGVLPEQLKKQWRRFKPEGAINASGTLTFDGSLWKSDATVDCLGVSCEDAERFPYRLTNARGVVRYTSTSQPKSGTLGIQLQGSAEGRGVAIAAAFRELPTLGESRPPGPRVPCPVGWVEITASRLRVTPAMIAALKPHAQAHKIAQSLSPTGEFGMRWRMERANAQVLSPAIETDLEAIDCAINYDRFPYPLEHLRGRITGRGNVWRFEGIESREANGPRVVIASGGLMPENGRQTFRLQLTAKAAALDETLRNALPQEQQAVWRDLRPQGRVSLTTNVRYSVGDPQPQIDVTLSPHAQSVSIEPTFFHYRLDRLEGRFVLRGGKVEFTGARAEHGRTVLTGAGSWTPGVAGSWQFRLEGLNVDYLDADHDLRLAAPLALRRVIDDLQPVGNFGIHNGSLIFTYDPSRASSLRTDWDIQLDCHQTDVNFGTRVEGISGVVRLLGVSDGKTCRASGELDIDTMFWNGLQLTNVRGPLYSDSSECLLGRGVAEKQPGAPHTPITAEAYGGRVSFNTRVLYGNRPHYMMAVGLTGVDLDRFSRDYLEAESPLTGRAAGQFNFEGHGASIYGLKGTGVLDVSEANLYELPVAVALLKVLRNRTPDTKAFDGCHAEFTMEGEHLTFDRLDLLGDAVSLYGRGTASLDKKVNLTFHTIVGRHAPSIPLVRSFIGQASEQILRLRVLGTIDTPEIRREALPVVGNVLEQLRADLQPKQRDEPAEVPRAAALRRQVK